MDSMTLPLQLTKSAIRKVKSLIIEKNNLNLKLRIYITGGGCGGFQYGFIIDNKINDNDIIFEREGVELIVDPMSLQYLIGGIIDYTEKLEGSHFLVINPNAKNTCRCGLSFSV